MGLDWSCKPLRRRAFYSRNGLQALLQRGRALAPGAVVSGTAIPVYY
jgi:hypothetical protein